GRAQRGRAVGGRAERRMDLAIVAAEGHGAPFYCRPRYRAAEERMPFTALGRDNVHFAVTGPAAAPPLLLIHSLGASSHVFDALAPALERAFRVVRYDLPGHGLSSPPAAGAAASVAGLAQGAAALLDRLGIARAHVFGLSLGGQVALALAATTPGCVDRLVLCATAPRLGSPELWSQRSDAVKSGGLASLAGTGLARWAHGRLAGRPPPRAGGPRGGAPPPPPPRRPGGLGAARAPPPRARAAPGG